MSSPEEVEKIIRDSVTAAEAKGITIQTNGWGLGMEHDYTLSSPRNCCCLLATTVLGERGNHSKFRDAVLLSTKSEFFLKCAAERLGVTEEQAEAITLGFDGHEDDFTFAHPEYAAIGRKFRYEIFPHLLDAMVNK